LIVVALMAGMVGCVSSPAQYDPTTPTHYHLSISASEGGGIAALGEGTFTYDEGEVVSLIATPADGYRFASWTGDTDTIDDVDAASTTVTMSGDYSITANFEAIRGEQRNLTVSSTAGGSVTLPGEGTFACNAGGVAELVASPDAGHRFAGWTGDVDTIDDVQAASTTITMDGDYSVTANFVPQYVLETDSTDGGDVTIPGEGAAVYDAGAVVELLAEADAGYWFAGWTGDVDTIDDVEAASTTIAMNGNCSITANFDRIPATSYTLTVAVSGSGLATQVVEQHTYGAGAVVLIAATPPCGYSFVNWTGDVETIADVNSSRTTITMNGDYFIIANFARITVTYYTLTVAVSGSGSTSPAMGQHTYATGTVVPITGTPAGGYCFVNWSGDVGTIASVTAASTTITINGDYSITANFGEVSMEQFDLTTSSTTGGSVTVPGEGAFTYGAGTVVGLTATPDTGYRFDGWMGDVGTIANVNAASTTITMSGSYSIRADFSEEPGSPAGIDYTEPEAEALIIALVNGQRQQSGLTSLSQDSLLSSLAREHSISMVVNHFFGHQRYPGERDFSYGMPPGTIRGENIAMIPTRSTIPGPYLSLQQVCEWAVSAWMSSPGHRANILEPRYTKTGVGVGFSEGGDYLYITQIFEGAY
jgi:uncharacterized protein YkwD